MMPSDAAARERIEKTKNARQAKNRICAYALLEVAYFDLFSQPMPPLSFDGMGGKPFLCDGKIKISISHTDEFCAVAFSESDVGVDVQSYSEMLGREGALKRFVNEDLQNVLKMQKSAEVEYLFYEIKDSNIVRIFLDQNDLFDKEFSLTEAKAAGEWSRLEAILKCGCGFGDYKNAKALAAATSAQTRFLSTAALSVAVAE